MPSPVDPGSRPLLARIRQSLCDALQSEIEGAGVLDLFAGSGIVGIEMLSRGAAAVTFVDSSPRATHRIAETMQLFHVEQDRALALTADALRPSSWTSHDLPGAPWSLVFVGTPYRLVSKEEGRHRLADALETLSALGALSTGACTVIQFEPGRPLDLSGRGWTEAADRRRISGRTGLALWYPPQPR